LLKTNNVTLLFAEYGVVNGQYVNVHHYQQCSTN
jgi:hypothetical protein